MVTLNILIKKGIVASAISTSTFTEMCKEDLAFSENGYFLLPLMQKLTGNLLSRYK